MNPGTLSLVIAVRIYANTRGWTAVSQMTNEKIAQIITGSSNEMGAKRMMSRYVKGGEALDRFKTSARSGAFEALVAPVPPKKEIPRYVTFGRLFDPNFKADDELTTEEEIWNRFDDLAGDLSPENLTCDGELGARQVRSRLAELKARWAALEVKLGRKVTEAEVWDTYRARHPGPQKVEGQL